MARTELKADTGRTVTDLRPVVVAPPPGHSLLGTALQAVFLVIMLAILAGVMLMLFTVASLMNVSGQVAGGVGSQLSGVATQASHAVSGAQQALENATDPNHPPTGLVYDNELSALDTWRVGDGLPGGTQYVLTVQSIQRRGGTASSDTAMYAVIHAELRDPRVIRIFGQTVHSDSDAHDYAVYKGEVFRIGHNIFRVNWISQDQASLAAGVLRHPDGLTQTLKFEYD